MLFFYQIRKVSKAKVLPQLSWHHCKAEVFCYMMISLFSLFTHAVLGRLRRSKNWVTKILVFWLSVLHIQAFTEKESENILWRQTNSVMGGIKVRKNHHECDEWRGCILPAHGLLHHTPRHISQTVYCTLHRTHMTYTWNIWYNEHDMPKSVCYGVSTLDLYHHADWWPLSWYRSLLLILPVIQILACDIQYGI